MATLRNAISAVFQKQLGEDELPSLFAGVVAAGYVVVDERQFGHNLPP